MSMARRARANTIDYAAIETLVEEVALPSLRRVVASLEGFIEVQEQVHALAHNHPKHAMVVRIRNQGWGSDEVHAPLKDILASLKECLSNEEGGRYGRAQAGAGGRDGRVC